MKYENLFTPIDLGGVTLKNRIVFAPTSMGLGKEAYVEKMKTIAAGGCAMIVVGDVPVSRHSGHGGWSLYSRKGFLYYQELCRVVHEQGCQVAAQLHQSDSNLKAMLKYIPGLLAKKITADQMRNLLNQEVGKYITQLPVEKVERITASFGEAARLAKKAGFDLIQVHGDRMCGSFSSIIYNARTDSYGGSAENRSRFAVEAVAAVHKALPDLPIDYKLAVRMDHPHYGNAGVLMEELAVFVPALEKAGVTSFHVALANHGELSDTIPPANHPYFSEEGCFLFLCDAVRKLTKRPVCGVGGLTDPDFVEEQIASGRVDYVAMSRQLIADSEWPNKVQNGRHAELHRCVRCNQDCLGGMKRHEGVHCIYDKKCGMNL